MPFKVQYHEDNEWHDYCDYEYPSMTPIVPLFDTTEEAKAFVIEQMMEAAEDMEPGQTHLPHRIVPLYTLH